jgi:hypothetical protein
MPSRRCYFNRLCRLFQRRDRSKVDEHDRSSCSIRERADRAVLYAMQGGIAGSSGWRLACALTLAGPSTEWDKAVRYLRTGNAQQMVFCMSAKTFDGQKVGEAAVNVAIQMYELLDSHMIEALSPSLKMFIKLRVELGLASLDRFEASKEIQKDAWTHFDEIAERSGPFSPVWSSNRSRCQQRVQLLAT